jgi:PAS domain S-box-containing protein
MTELDRELQTQFVSEVYVSLVAHVTLFALLSTLVWSAVPPRALAWWGGAIVGVSGIRMILWNVARRKNLRPRRVTQMARATMLALGLAWGIGAAFLFRFLPVAEVALILLGLTGLLAGGLATLVADRWTFPIYAIAMFVPPAVVVGGTGPGLFNEFAVVLILIYLAFAIRLHLRSHDSLRKRLTVEAALREGQRQLSEAQRIAHVGSWEWDIKANVVMWSDELRRMYGVGAGATAGYREFLALAHPDDRARLEALVAEGLQARRTVDYEWRVVRPDGEVRYMQARNVVITDDTGQAIRMAGTSLDVTDRKVAEENQRTLLRELQASAAEVKVLRGILPICATCKRIRGDDGKWEAVESYVRDHSHAEFSHGLCADCAAKTWS